VKNTQTQLEKIMEIWINVVQDPRINIKHRFKNYKHYTYYPRLKIFKFIPINRFDFINRIFYKMECKEGII